MAQFRSRDTTEEEKNAFAAEIRRFGEKLIPYHPTSLNVIFDLISDYDELDNHFLNNVTMQLSFLLQRNIDEAEILADQVLPHCHRYPDMLLWMTRIYCKKNRHEDALKLVELAAKHGYRAMPRFRNYEELESLWTMPRFQALFS